MLSNCLSGLQNDLRLTDHQYSVALTVTFISYVIVEFPATLFLKKIGPNILLPTLIIIWGIITTLQGFVKSYSGLIAARILKQRLERDRPVLFEENERFSFSEVFACLKSPHVLLNSLSLFMTGTVDFSLAYFQPTIVNSLGYSAVRSQLLTIPPSVVSFIVMLGTGFISDRFQARGLTACGCALTSMTGFLIFYVTKPQQTSLKYASLFFSVAGSYSLVPPLQTWQANNSEGHYRRATAIILGACVGNLGGILSTWLFPLSQKPEYHTGTSLNLAFSIAVFVTTLFNLFWLRRLNFNKRKYRDQILSKYQVKEGASGESELNEKKRAHRELGDQHPDFIYAY
ncbi:hypothetical protein O181_003186 [Austropuccinia psidii MF-1]|uniref:Major facilitator superfamily (MFS) profile domain-containing protein n=1 Tax=Austropuccinia psidii MF-1 TaxID=1389203 RepID=A0A9Q3BDC7_9BASI|nr:hypothetical protein [Austropuccinia psidii MF-1]